MKVYMKTIRETAFETNPDKSPEIPGFEIEKHYAFKETMNKTTKYYRYMTMSPEIPGGGKLHQVR